MAGCHVAWIDPLGWPLGADRPGFPLTELPKIPVARFCHCEVYGRVSKMQITPGNFSEAISIGHAFGSWDERSSAGPGEGPTVSAGDDDRGPSAWAGALARSVGGRAGRGG